MIKIINEISSRKNGKELYSKIVKLLTEQGVMDKVVRYTPSELKAHANWVYQYEMGLSVAQMANWRSQFLEQEYQFIMRILNTTHNDNSRIENMNTQTARWFKQAMNDVLATIDSVAGEHKPAKANPMIDDWNKLPRMRFNDEA